MIEVIKSLKDSRIQLARELNSSKGRAKSNKFLIEGSESILWAIESGVAIDFVLISDKIDNIDSRFNGNSIYKVSDGILKKVTDTNYLIPEVAVGELPHIDSRDDFVLVLDGLQDFGNIGTVVRTCQAFGVNSIFSTKADIDLFQRKCVSSSRGRVFSTAVTRFKNSEATVLSLKEKGYQIVTTSPYGSQIQSLVKLTDKPIALVIGNETNGASDELMNSADITVQIPMYSSVESLNVGVATGISIYELRLKQILSMLDSKIKTTLGREVNVASVLIKEVLDKELKKVSDLSSTHIVFLMVLKCDGVMSVSDIRRQFGISEHESDEFFSILFDKGYIAKEKSDSVTITDTGIETIGKLWTIIENSEDMILGGFTDNERNDLFRLIRKLQSACIDLLNKD
jgi:TrmH family RNA methyltransferase